jgi:dihydroorotate dehydrogenase electron transfer subunit
MIKKDWMTVLSLKTLALNIYELKLQGELSQLVTAPGQFVHIKIGNGFSPLLRRPISIADVNHEEKSITLIFRAEGKGTKLLATVKAGEQLDVLGPLGNGFSLEAINQGETALLVGGGIGVPPMYYLAKQLKAKGVTVLHALGFATKDVVFYEEEFSMLGDTVVVTIDGSRGDKGYVTDGILNKGWDFDLFFACGPTPMLKALTNQYGDQKGFLSLEERMGCGIGACFACVCHAENGYRKICSDGPVFPVGEVTL